MTKVPAEPAVAEALVFFGFDAWGSRIALPVPHGNMGLTCVWIKNNQLASAKPIYNVRVKAEYSHNSNPEFILQTACFWHKPFKSPGPTTWQERIDLEANETQAIPIFMDPSSTTLLDPPWPQSAMDEHHATRALRLGRWTIRLTITADGVPPLIGEIEFTIYQQPGQDNLSIGCHAGMGALRLPLVPDTRPQKGWWHLGVIWRWVGGKWQWAPLSAASATFIKFNEYTIGLFFLVLSAFSVVSKISHWKTDDEKQTRLVRRIGYFVVLGAFIFFSILAVRIKGNEPWSHLSPQEVKQNPVLHANSPLQADSPPSPTIQLPTSQSSPHPSTAKAAASKVVNNCPNGICISGGTVTNPTVVNIGEIKPDAKLTHSVHADPAKDGDDPDSQRLSVTVFTDRAISAAVVAIVLSKPAKIDGPVGIAYGIPFSTHSMTLTDPDGRPMPNGVAVPLDLPAAFQPGQQLIISLITKKGSEVQKVFNVVPH